MMNVNPDTPPGHSSRDATLPAARTPKTTTTIGSYCLAIARALENSGVDSARIFRAAGIPAGLSNSPMSRLPTASVTRLYHACVAVTNNPYFGLSVARHASISNLHALGYALAASSTLMNVCRRMERYFRLLAQSAKISVSEADGKVYFRVERLVDISGESEDAFLGFLVLTMRQLYKPGFNPLRVEFHRPMPREGAEPYETLMRAPLSFGHTDSLLVFDHTDMMQTLDGSCSELAQVNDNIAIDYLARLDRDDVVTGVRKKIIDLLPNGKCSRTHVASALHMSPSTLQLKLAQRGTSFQRLLDDTRKELACSYMQQATRSVTEITYMLGFADTSNFTRAFKRWTGMSPTDFRRRS